MKCEISDCATNASFNFAHIESRRVVAETHLCDAHAQAFFAQFRATISVGDGTRYTTPGGVCVDLEGIAYNNCGDPPGCVYVHEVGGKRRFPMIVDGWAWWALMAHIKQQAAPYPRTHAAWAATIEALGGEVKDVFVDRTGDQDWWLGRLRIVKDGHIKTISVRACDAYTLAVICGVPIFVAEKALERYADTGDAEGGTLGRFTEDRGS
ncbi:MAG: bifunctional nuclease family protein [Pirellulaceae bacterium]|jgi:bifunctional DNase/RNase|nr:bifunctional nuclease family protein [Pirellulaceae bacterium]